MACPFFHPSRRMAEGPVIPRFGLPLGAWFEGECRVPGLDPSTPDRERLVSACNIGYPRDCARFPASAAADAARYLVVEEIGGTVRVAWVIEKDYHPVSCGTLDTPGGGDDAIGAQARAYAGTFRERLVRDTYES